MMLRRTIPFILLAGSIGAALMYFLDPKSGNRRRKMTVQQVVGAFHHSRARIAHTGRTSSARVYGLWQRLTHLKPTDRPTPNDETLTQRVRSRLLRNPHLSAHRININSEYGVVVLRGEVDDPKQISHLEKEARSIPGVLNVKNLLHLPHTPAPMGR
jgi:osmotically-inducible protein OsmY